MNNNETAKNETVEIAEEAFGTADLSKSAKIIAGVGLTVLVGAIAYKYIGKPVIANIKARIESKKAAKEQTSIPTDSDVDEEEI